MARAKRGMRKSARSSERVIEIDAADCGPRNAKVGDIMTASWDDGRFKRYRFDGKRWILDEEGVSPFARRIV